MDRDTDYKTEPKHYTDMGEYSPLHIIERYNLGFTMGNVIKYALRAGLKEGETELDDLKKAQWYLNWRIRKLEEAKAPGQLPQRDV